MESLILHYSTDQTDLEGGEEEEEKKREGFLLVTDPTNAPFLTFLSENEKRTCFSYVTLLVLSVSQSFSERTSAEVQRVLSPSHRLSPG